jgi:hypothetical protein
MNSSAKPPPVPPDAATARACLATNLMVLPGLGTRLAGRPGWLPQMLLAILGFAALVGWGLSVGISWALEGGLSWGEPPWSRLGLVGLVLSLMSWAWSLASGLALVREARQSGPAQRSAPAHGS